MSRNKMIVHAEVFAYLNKCADVINMDIVDTIEFSESFNIDDVYFVHCKVKKNSDNQPELIIGCYKPNGNKLFDTTDTIKEVSLDYFYNDTKSEKLVYDFFNAIYTDASVDVITDLKKDIAILEKQGDKLEKLKDTYKAEKDRLEDEVEELEVVISRFKVNQDEIEELFDSPIVDTLGYL